MHLLQQVGEECKMTIDASRAMTGPITIKEKDPSKMSADMVRLDWLEPISSQYAAHSNGAFYLALVISEPLLSYYYLVSVHRA